jgi:hypothetical protein
VGFAPAVTGTRAAAASVAGDEGARRKDQGLRCSLSFPLFAVANEVCEATRDFGVQGGIVQVQAVLI